MADKIYKLWEKYDSIIPGLETEKSLYTWMQENDIYLHFYADNTESIQYSNSENFRSNISGAAGYRLGSKYDTPSVIYGGATYFQLPFEFTYYKYKYQEVSTTYRLIAPGAFPQFQQKHIRLTTPGTYTLYWDKSGVSVKNDDTGSTVQSIGKSECKDGVSPRLMLFFLQGAGGGGAGVDYDWGDEGGGGGGAGGFMGGTLKRARTSYDNRYIAQTSFNSLGDYEASVTFKIVVGVGGEGGEALDSASEPARFARICGKQGGSTKIWNNDDAANYAESYGGQGGIASNDGKNGSGQGGGGTGGTWDPGRYGFISVVDTAYFPFSIAGQQGTGGGMQLVNGAGWQSQGTVPARTFKVNNTMWPIGDRKSGQTYANKDYGLGGGGGASVFANGGVGMAYSTTSYSDLGYKTESSPGFTTNGSLGSGGGGGSAYAQMISHQYGGYGGDGVVDIWF